MFGTKRPSITSTWIQSAPAASTARTSSASRPKSAERIEGAIFKVCRAATDRVYQAREPAATRPVFPGSQRGEGRYPPARMQARPLTKADYDEIVNVIDRWWGGPTTALAHPMFFYELGRLARVVEADGHLVGFL